MGLPGMGRIPKMTGRRRSEEHTSELQSQSNLVCRLLLEKKKNNSQSFSTSSFVARGQGAASCAARARCVRVMGDEHRWHCSFESLTQFADTRQMHCRLLQ